MARGRASMDEEARAIQRCAREIERLEEPAAQARVALYLHLRYTSAGDQIAPGSGTAPVPVGITPVPAGIAPVPAGIAANDPSPHRTPSGATQGHVGPVSDQSPADSEGSEEGDQSVSIKPSSDQLGWDLSGMGSENDDNPDDMDVEI